ncbi:MAG: DNA mismatch endonuclease Vsr [Rhodospirillales bacterium]|nr:DNA mismatch endonuclease Vsr [Rhodospirillales bacterium]
MADIVDRATRSRMMAGIRGRDTKPEIRLRVAMHAAGFRFRLHVATLPGKPDLVFPRFRAVVFVQGCFWHRHQGCPACTIPASNAEFWSRKFEENVARDARNVTALRATGWRVATVWECAVRRMSDKELSDAVGNWLGGARSSLLLPRTPRAGPLKRKRPSGP